MAYYIWISQVWYMRRATTHPIPKHMCTHMTIFFGTNAMASACRSKMFYYSKVLFERARSCHIHIRFSKRKKKIIPFIAILKTLNTQTGATSIDFPHTHDDDDPYHIIAGGMRCWFCEELTTTVAILRQGVQCCFFFALCVQFPDVCIVALLLLLMHRPWFCVYVCVQNAL